MSATKHNTSITGSLGQVNLIYCPFMHAWKENKQKDDQHTLDRSLVGRALLVTSIWLVSDIGLEEDLFSQARIRINNNMLVARYKTL